MFKSAKFAALAAAMAGLAAGPAAAEVSQTQVVTCSHPTSEGVSYIYLKHLDAARQVAIVAGRTVRGFSYGDFQVPYKDGRLEYTPYLPDGQPRNTYRLTVLQDLVQGDTLDWAGAGRFSQSGIQWKCDSATANAGKPVYPAQIR
jgi:hypothetical protein